MEGYKLKIFVVAKLLIPPLNKLYAKPAKIAGNPRRKRSWNELEQMGEANTSSVDDDLLLKNFYAEVSEVERDNEVARYHFSPFFLYCFMLYAFLIVLFTIGFLLFNFLEISMNLYLKLRVNVQKGGCSSCIAGVCD